jgi:eukaryotic-like serine/threonine-protein kinase
MKSEALALFREVADRSPAEREVYYAEHRIEAALRSEVESLLRFDGQSDSLHHYVAAAASRMVTDQQRSITVPLTGRRFGVFEVQGLLGAGGMGEVYRARDTRLGRDVAIKILPYAFRDDHDHVVRFEREARILASLNHPHIGVVHGLEEVGGLKALVMELVEGETLAERLAHGPLPVSDALDIARQVAEALEAAHTQGIVHRDLKPANIKWRPDGAIKVLDFGLAKPLAWSADDPVGPTVTGVIGGTPAYMSPEQARGEGLDAQADIWSFGVVLFELLTGISPFARKTSADTLAIVLSSPPDYSLLPTEMPPSIRHLIRRCLEKDRRRRLKHIGDARLELEEALSQSGANSAINPAHAAARVPAERTRRLGRAAALVTAAFATGAVIGALWLAPGPSRAPVVRTIIPADALVSTTDRSFAFTVDGRSLAYVSGDARQIFVRPLDALEPTAILTTAAYIRGLSPAPDGRWLGFVENNFTLKKIATTGGAAVTVAMMDGPSRGLAWGPDDTIVFASGAPETGLQRVSSGGGPVAVLTRPDPARGELDHVQPGWLPGGRRVLFTILSARGGLDAAKIAILDVATGATHTVLEGGYGARYVDGGHLVYAAAGGLWSARFDPTQLGTQGAPVEILKSVVIEPVGATPEFDIARDGTLAYLGGATSSGTVVPVWVDREGHETPLPAPPGRYRHPRLSPDGKRLAVDPHRGGEGDIYVWDLARPWSSAVRMTVAAGNDWFPVWTPGGRHIVFGSWRGGRFSNLYMLDLATGSTERLTDSPDMQVPTSITADGKTVIFHSFTKSLQALRLDSRGEPITLVETLGEERNGDLSPDGRWLAYEGESPSAPGQLDISVRPFPDVNRGLWQVTRDGGTFPVWSRNGRELFYITLDGTVVAVPVETAGNAWNGGSPTKLFRGPYDIREGSLGRQYDVAPDGRFLMLKREAAAAAPHFVLVQNWVAEVARQGR